MSAGDVLKYSDRDLGGVDRGRGSADRGHDGSNSCDCLLPGSLPLYIRKMVNEQIWRGMTLHSFASELISS